MFMWRLRSSWVPHSATECPPPQPAGLGTCALRSFPEGFDAPQSLGTTDFTRKRAASMCSFLLDPSSAVKPQTSRYWWFCGWAETRAPGVLGEQRLPVWSQGIGAGWQGRGCMVAFFKVPLQGHGAIIGLGAWPGWGRGASWTASNSRKTRPAEVDDSISLIWAALCREAGHRGCLGVTRGSHCLALFAFKGKRGQSLSVKVQGGAGPSALPSLCSLVLPHWPLSLVPVLNHEIVTSNKNWIIVLVPILWEGKTVPLLANYYNVS